MTIQTEADIAGANAKVQISSTAGAQARRLWLCAFGGNARFGDVNVAAARGVELKQDVPAVFSASDGDATDTIDLTAAYAYVPSGTTLTVSWGV
jgi:hypothetical protein